MEIPEIRIQQANACDVNADGSYVLYWMTASRRSRWNYGLQRAAWWSRELDKPLLIFEAIRAGYPWASDRLHRFVLQGMTDNYAAFADTRAKYLAYIEPAPGHGRGLLNAISEQASVVVTDEFPCFFLPRMIQKVAGRLPMRFEAIDSNGLLPLRAAERVYSRAYDFRRFLQAALPDHLVQPPAPNPLDEFKLPGWGPSLQKRLHKRVKDWIPSPQDEPVFNDDLLLSLPIDHTVGKAAFDGGSLAAQRALEHFLENGLPRYADARNHPDHDASSQLSPYLHFGHIAAHEVFDAIARQESWSPLEISDKINGSREGWWGMSPSAEAFLDQLSTWRDLGYNMCSLDKNYDRYESLPKWALESLKQHANDPRDPCYDLETFENADTHDNVWNAAQNELRREGRMHNYLRMLWGKKILHWSKSPQDALAIMIQLNNKYAVDGRNPNSYSGIFWVLGRYDRAWGPERPIFGKIRYMTSDSTVKKLKMKNYLAEYA